MAAYALADTIGVIAKKLEVAAESLVTVKVITLYGDAAFAANVGSGNGVVAPDNTGGAYSACNMVTGDITACYSMAIVDAGQIKALHDDALKLGTETFRANVTLLKTILLELIDKQNSTPG